MVSNSRGVTAVNLPALVTPPPLQRFLYPSPIFEYHHFRIREDKKKILRQLSFGFGNVREGRNVASLEAVTALGSNFSIRVLRVNRRLIEL